MDIADVLLYIIEETHFFYYDVLLVVALEKFVFLGRG